MTKTSGEQIAQYTIEVFQVMVTHKKLVHMKSIDHHMWIVQVLICAVRYISEGRYIPVVWALKVARIPHASEKDVVL